MDTTITLGQVWAAIIVAMVLVLGSLYTTQWMVLSSLRYHLRASETRLDAQFDSLESRLSGFETTIMTRLDATEIHLGTPISRLRADIQDANRRVEQSTQDLQD